MLKICFDFFSPKNLDPGAKRIVLSMLGESFVVMSNGCNGESWYLYLKEKSYHLEQHQNFRRLGFRTTDSTNKSKNCTNKHVRTSYKC